MDWLVKIVYMQCGNYSTAMTMQHWRSTRTIQCIYTAATNTSNKLSVCIICGRISEMDTNHAYTKYIVLFMYSIVFPDIICKLARISDII